MSVITKLNGWNIGVERTKFKQPGENGAQVEVEGFSLIFTEMQPPTGNRIVFECSKEVGDFIVRRITGVILPGLEFPNL